MIKNKTKNYVCKVKLLVVGNDFEITMVFVIRIYWFVYKQPLFI